MSTALSAAAGRADAGKSAQPSQRRKTGAQGGAGARSGEMERAASVARGLQAAGIASRIVLDRKAGEQMGKALSASIRGRRAVVLCSPLGEKAGAGAYGAYNARVAGAQPVVLPLLSEAPTVECVKAAVAASARVGAEMVVGVGGRGVVEVARAVSMLLANAGSAEDFACDLGATPPPIAPLPCALVPTLPTARECARSATLMAAGRTSLTLLPFDPPAGEPGADECVLLDPSVLSGSHRNDLAPALMGVVITAIEQACQVGAPEHARYAAWRAALAGAWALRLLGLPRSGPPPSSELVATLAAEASVVASAAVAAASTLSSAPGPAAMLGNAAAVRYEVSQLALSAACGASALEALEDREEGDGSAAAEEAMHWHEHMAGAMARLREAPPTTEALDAILEAEPRPSGRTESPDAAEGEELLASWEGLLAGQPGGWAPGALLDALVPEDLSSADMWHIAAGAMSEPGAAGALAGLSTQDLVRFLDESLDR